MFTDSHCHLFNECFDNIDEVIRKAKENNVNRYISAADSLNTCYEMIELAEKYDNVFITLGIHPENYNDSIDKLRKIL